MPAIENGDWVNFGDWKSFLNLVYKAKFEAMNAMTKFPQPNYVSLKIAEEAGEVVRACVHYAEDRATWEDVQDETVQLLAMLIRLHMEGDQINGIIPPNLKQALPKPGGGYGLDDMDYGDGKGRY